MTRGRRSLVRVRSPGGVVHWATEWPGGAVLCYRKIARGKIVREPGEKVTCRECLDTWDQRRLNFSVVPAEPRDHPVTNSHRAAKRGHRYLAHWVLQPYYDPKRRDSRLTEHRLYVERRREPPNYDDGSGG